LAASVTRVAQEDRDAVALAIFGRRCGFLASTGVGLLAGPALSANLRAQMDRNLILRQVDSLIVARQNTEAPHDFEWNAFLSMLEQNAERFDKIKIFVRTPGGGPTPTQANRLRSILKNKPVLVAVVSESVVIRFLGSSIALLNRDLRIFLPDELHAAYHHLKLSPREREIVESIVDEMAFELY
jgi:hypothetical protein